MPANSLILMICLLTVSSDLTLLSWNYWAMSTQSVIVTYTLTSSSYLNLYFSWFFDFKTFMFLTAVSLVSVGVMGFSSDYMTSEPFFSRFHALVLLFIFSMILLILGCDLMSILVGWDGLGVSSFLLVVYFQNNNSWGAGMLTVMTNRIGDALLIMACAMLMNSGMPEPLTAALHSSTLSYSMCLLFIIAASTKSAQLPFSAWLPAAMAAPTPVSSLVHSSTLVTAGVYLLTRFEATFSASHTNLVLLALGSLTMCVAGRAALWEPDLKKMVALSTLSQLGLMVATLGMGHPSMAFFHLVMHAFFKSLLFMAAGTMIHALGDYQDMRMVALAPSSAPFALSTMLISNFALMGLPFLSGFYSKDLILETTFSTPLSMTVWFLFFLGTAFTILYSMRFSYNLTGTSMKQNLLWSGEQSLSTLKTCAGQLVSAVLAGRLIFLFCPFETSFIFLTQWMKVLVLLLIILTVLLSNTRLFAKLSSSPQKFMFLHAGNIGGAPVGMKALEVPLNMKASSHLAELSELTSLPLIKWVSAQNSMKPSSVWAMASQATPNYFMAMIFLLATLLTLIAV